MKTIWKFELKRDLGLTFLEIPRDARIVFVAAQGKRPCLWAEVDPDKPTIQRRFVTYGTGWAMPDQDQQYLGSYMLDKLENGALFHIYELTEDQ